MSNRALRKLHGKKDDIAVLANNLNIKDDDEDSEEDLSNVIVPAAVSAVKAQNLFSLLNNGDEENGSDTKDSDQDSSSNQLVEETADLVSEEVKDNGTKPKKKKKKKNKAKKQELPSDELADDDEFQVPALQFDSSASSSSQLKSPLTIEQKHLNPENELKRIFGSRVIQAEQKRKARGKARTRTMWLVNPNVQWAHMGRTGLSMSIDRSENGICYFKFEHNKDYREIQFKFWDAVSSLSPDNIVAITNLYPFHIDSLLQLSDICRMGEDVQMATELIERALYVMESALHPSFNFATGNCRLDYRVQENRAFFLAIFKHLNYVGQRGCYRTALEFCKVLFSLDPDNDPLAVILLIDFYALKAEEYSWLIDFYQFYEPLRNLSQLPNFAFAVALAHFYAADGDADSIHMKRADSFLQEALLNFPGALIPLLDKCSIQADPEVMKNPFFGPKSQISQSPALTNLIQLYIGRSFHLWKNPSVLPWLERNAHAVLEKAKNRDLISKYEEKRKRRFQGTPRNIYRHIILSEIKDATASLPPDLADAPLMSFDPLPPLDSIVSYSRPRRSRQDNAGSNEGLLSSFFRSLMPGYNVQNQPYEPGAPWNHPWLEDPAAAVAAAGPAQENPDGQGAGGAAAELRQSVNTLMDAVRNLLHNVYSPEAANAPEESDDSPNED